MKRILRVSLTWALSYAFLFIAYILILTRIFEISWLSYSIGGILLILYLFANIFVNKRLLLSNKELYASLGIFVLSIILEFLFVFFIVVPVIPDAHCVEICEEGIFKFGVFFFNFVGLAVSVVILILNFLTKDFYIKKSEKVN